MLAKGWEPATDERGRFVRGEDATRDFFSQTDFCYILCANQIFNPTSMCAYANVLTRALPPCFENSLRAIDSSKNQPNRLRFDRAREF